MARFYAPFDPNYTNSGLENAAGRNRRWIAGGISASAATVRNGLIASRSALSGQMLAQLNAANTFVTPTRGIIIPGDGISFSAGNLSWNNVYSGSIHGLKYEADPSVRISQSISVNDTNIVGAVTPADPGSILQGYYYSASAAVDETLRLLINSASGGDSTLVGPYQRPGNYPSRTLHSVYHDYQLTYFGWDDFTPGFPRDFIANTPGNTGTPVEYFYSTNYVTDYNWSSGQSNYEFKNDINAAVILNVSIYATSSTPGEQGTLVDSISTTLSPGSFTYTWSTPDPVGIGKSYGEFYISSSVRYRDQTLFTETPSTTSLGATAGTPYPGTNILLTKLYSRTLSYRSDYSSTCTNYTSPTTRYMTSDGSLSAFVDSIYQSTNTYSPAGVANGFYYDSSYGKVYEVTDNNGTVETVSTCT